MVGSMIKTYFCTDVKPLFADIILCVSEIGISIPVIVYYYVEPTYHPVNNNNIKI